MNNILLTICFILGVISLNAQQISVQIESFPANWNNESSEYFYGGSGLSIDYKKAFDFGKLGVGVEFRTINWGNQISLTIPYNHNYVVKDSWNISASLTPTVGLALYRPKSLLVWSVEYVPEFTWTPRKKLEYFFGFGMRYSNNPAYGNYGKINRVLEYPIKLGVKINLKPRKE